MIPDTVYRLIGDMQKMLETLSYDEETPRHIRNAIRKHQLGLDEVRTKINESSEDRKYPYQIRAIWKKEEEKKESNKMKKSYYVQHNIGKAKYVVSFHDGKNKHEDGSRFYDIKIFKNKKDLGEFLTTLTEKGYVEE